MSDSAHQSWGRAIPSLPARVFVREWTGGRLPSGDLLLAYGRGRSYGDVCLNNGHALIDTRFLSRFRRFDAEAGVLECESGVTLDAILRLIVPQGWFLPVLPGTRYVTVGGAIANDIHGKNHHRAGTFGCHVRSLELQRSDGSRIRCSPDGNSALFGATIGGLGLTGLILSAELSLRPIRSPSVVVESLPFRSLLEFEALSRESDGTHEYTVAWLDSQRKQTRGIFFRGNHATEGARAAGPAEPHRLPLAPLAPFLNSLSVRAFNEIYFRANARQGERAVPYAPFFAPLDAVANWNAVYGRRGFLQYQFVVPDTAGLEPVEAILRRAADSRRASFLTVIKKFGTVGSPGLLSFPRAGITVALDFANQSGIEELLETFDEIVASAGGRVYPAKDARMSPARFRTFFPDWERLAEAKDPRFSSSFWRRVTR